MLIPTEKSDRTHVRIALPTQLSTLLVYDLLFNFCLDVSSDLVLARAYDHCTRSTMAIDSEQPPAEIEEEEIPEPVPVVHAEHEPLDEGEESDEYDIEVHIVSLFLGRKGG